MGRQQRASYHRTLILLATGPKGPHADGCSKYLVVHLIGGTVGFYRQHGAQSKESSFKPAPMPPAFATPLALCLALIGVVLGEACLAHRYVLFGVALMACAATCAALIQRRWSLIAAICTLVAVFAARTAWVPHAPVPSSAAFADEATLWRARVITTPVVHLERGGKTHVQATVMLLSQRRGNTWYPECGRVSLTLRCEPMVVRNDILQVALIVRPLVLDQAPWQPSAHTQQVVQQRSAIASVRGLHVVVVRGQGAWANLDRWRQKATWAVEAALPVHVAAIVRALALGDTAGLSPEQRDAWADAGIAHLLAVSGLHVGLVAWGLRLVWWRLGALFPALVERYNVRALSAALALPGVWLYVAFCGGAVSAQRAGIMTTVVLLAQAMGMGSTSGAHTLGVAGLLILAWNPYAGQSPSFWLSFVAVGTLLSLSTPPPLPQSNKTALRVLHKMGRGLVWAWCTGACTTVCTAPWCISYFGRIPWLAPWTNLIAIPLGSLLGTPLAIGFAAMATLSPPQAPWLQACAWPVVHVLGGLDEGAKWISQWPHATFLVGPWGLRLSILLATFAASWRLLVWRTPIDIGERMRTHVLVRRLGALSLIAAVVFLSPGLLRRPPQALTVWQLDVGQGDCTLLHLPDGSWVLIDAGGALFAGQKDPGRHVVAPALRALGVTRLRAVILTHPHPDHMGGLGYVLNRWPVDLFWRNAEAAAFGSVQALDKLVKVRGGHIEDPSDHEEVWGGNVHIRAYQPLRGQKASINDHSIVLHLRYGPRTLLWMGDAETAAEYALLPHVPPAELIKVGHHGSLTSTSDALLRHVAPQQAIISCGVRNTFGHPHKKVLARLQNFGVTILRTDTQHTLKLVSVGQGLWQRGTQQNLAVLQPLQTH